MAIAPHTEQITQIAVNRDCSLIVTGSLDKTVRLWPATADVSLRTVRPPIGDGHEGQIYAVALSSDAKLVAAGGWDVADVNGRYNDNGVFLIDVSTGAIVRRLAGHRNTINGLAFSPDGNGLVVAMSGGAGIRMWRRQPSSSEWQVLQDDTTFDRASVLSVAFDRTGHVVASTDDGQVRRYSPDLRLQKRQTVRGKLPHALAVDPLGRRLAVGFIDSPVVQILDIDSLKTLYSLGQPLETGGSTPLAWSGDGNQLYVGGWSNGHGEIAAWDQSHHRSVFHTLKTHGTVRHLAPCGDRVAVATTDPAFGVLAKSGEAQAWRSNAKFDSRADTAALATSFDGKAIAFAVPSDSKRLLFTIEDESLSPLQTDIPLFEADTTGLAITSWRDSDSPTLRGKRLALDPFDRTRSLAIARDKQGFVLGSDWELQRYNIEGQLLWKMSAPGPVLGVTLTPDARLVVARYGDGTVRWHRFSDGAELLALFVDASDGRWVAWTPIGYYMASPGGEEIVPVGWHFNRARDLPADFYPIYLFRDVFYRPDLIEKIIDGTDLNAVEGQEPVYKALRDTSPPIIDRLDVPENGAFARSATL